MNRKNIHIFRGLDTDSSPLSVATDFAEEIHNLRITANEGILSNDTSVLNNPQNPINLTISPELSTRALIGNNNTPLVLEGNYIGHCVCNEHLVVFTQSDTYDIITKYKLETDTNGNMALTKILDLFKAAISSEEGFDPKYPIESLFCYENEKIQRLYWVDGKNQPRSINIANTVTYSDYNDINFSSKIEGIAYNIDIRNTPESNGEFKPGVIQYAMTLVANNDAESAIFYISPMYYLTNASRGESTDNMVHNVLHIEATISNNNNFKRVRIYAIAKTSRASINTRMILDRAIDDNSLVQVDDDGIIGETVDYTSLLYKGSENIVAYTMDQKDNTLFLGKLKYKRSNIPEIAKADYKINAIGVDYYGNAIYDYAGIDNSDKFNGSYGMDLEYHHTFDNIETHIRPNVSSYTPYSPFSKKYYEDNRILTRSSRGVKRFKTGEYYKLGIVGQLANGKMTQVRALDIVYNPYKPIFKQSANTNSIIVHKGTAEENTAGDITDENVIIDVRNYNSQLDTYITTGFRVLLSDAFIESCKAKGIISLYPVVVYPNNAYRAVLTQGLLSPTLVNIQETINDYPAIINSWYYRPYAKGIFDDTLPITLDSGDPLYPSVEQAVTAIHMEYDESVGKYLITFEGTFYYSAITRFNYAIDGGEEVELAAASNTASTYINSFSSLEVYAYSEDSDGNALNSDIVTFNSTDVDYIADQDAISYPNPIWTFNMQDFDAKGYYNSKGSIVALKDKRSYFSDGLNYNGVYNFACITTGAHYRGLYSSAFPNGEIDNNIIGCPVDYLLIWNKSNKYNWGRYGTLYSSGTDDRKGRFIHSSLDKKTSLRIQGPAMLYNNSSDTKELLSNSNYRKYMSGNFLMNCNILTLNSPETEQKIINNTRGDIGDYKFRIVGFSDYCSSRVTPKYNSKEGYIKPTISDIKSKYRLSKRSSYYCGAYNNTTYLKNRYIKSTPLERLGKWFRGVESGTSDDGWIPLNNAYLGDCTWSYTENGKYNNDFLPLKVSSNIAFGTTDYYVTGANIDIESCTYASEEVASLLHTVDNDYLFGTQEKTAAIYNADKNMFNDENASDKGARYTKLYNTNSLSRLRSSWAASWFCHWYNEDYSSVSKKAKGDFDTVQNHKGARTMYKRIPHILWWYPNNGSKPSGSTSEPINTIIDALPVWAPHTINNNSKSWEDINSLSSDGKYISSYDSGKGITINYFSSPYIVLSLGKTERNSDNVLCKDGYGLKDLDYEPFWKNSSSANSSIDTPKTYSCTSITPTLYGNLDMVGQFIGELYREPESVGISIMKDSISHIDYIDYESSTYMGGISEDPYHNWYICGEPINLNTPSDVQIYHDGGWDNESKHYELLFIEGDSYIGRFDSLKTYPYNQSSQGVVEIFSTVLESRINLDERVDFSDLDDLSTIVYSNYNLFNEDAYNQVPSLMNHHVEDVNAVIVDDLPNTLTWSLEKIYGANVDEWAHITMLNTLDLDGQYGVIESINNYKNNIYAFQNKAVSVINFNTRVQIPTSDNNPIEITNGYKVDGKMVIDNHYGCSNKWSITTGLNGVYFIDDINNKACLFNGQQVAPLSSTAKVQRLFNSLHTTSNAYYEEHLWNPEDFNYCRCFYDYRRNEVYYVFKEKAIVFNEILGTFVGTFDYGESVAMFNIGDYYSSIYNNQFYELFSKPDYDHAINRSDFGEIYGVTRPYNITYIEHGDTPNDKTFNTVEWQSNKEYEIFDTLSVGSVQHSNTSTLRYGYRGNVMRRFNYWRASLDRTTTMNNTVVMTHRERNPYFRISLRNNNPSLVVSPFLISDIVTTFSE